MATTISFIASIIQIVIPQPCYDEYFLNFNFLHVECSKIVISKVLGYGIIAGSVMVKVPQIAKIVANRDGRGISIVGISLELFAIVSSLSYGFASGYPFSSYGETMFLLIQTWLVGFCILYYDDNTSGALGFTGLLGILVAYTMSPLIPLHILRYLQTSVMFVMGVARMIQIVTNFRNGSTGQLSFVTVLLLFLGAVARIFTSMQETNDPVLVLSYASSTLFNGIIVAQVLWYWNAKTKTQ